MATTEKAPNGPYRFQQRWLHSYKGNEVMLMVMFVVICNLPTNYLFLGKTFHPYIARVWTQIVLTNILFLSMYPVLVYRRNKRPSAKIVKDCETARYKVPTFKQMSHTARDGVEINVRISENIDKTREQKVCLLACPLGLCGPSVYNGVMARFGPEYIYVSWDYRGFFKTKLMDASIPRMLNIQEHARDGEEVLRACGFDKCDVALGHSMGSAVILEMALLFPKTMGSLILFNGFHGHCFQFSFQPMCRIPMLADFFAYLISFLLRHQDYLKTVFHKITKLGPLVINSYPKLTGQRSKMMMECSGPSYLSDFLESYMGNLYTSPESFEAWLRMFQELDAHSVYHLLHTIKCPMLVVSGLFDPLIPAMTGVEIVRACSKATHYCDPGSTHASLLESPEWVVAEVDVFLTNHKLRPESSESSDKKQD